MQMSTHFDAEIPPVVVIGSAGIDIKGRPDYTLAQGASVPGRIRSSVGGVARNIAENLARLEVPTTLLTAVGDDAPGQRVLDRCQEAGIDTTHVCIVPGAYTGHYMTTLKINGERDTAISDYRIVDHIGGEYLRNNRALIRAAGMVVIDANLNDDTLKTLFQLAARYKVPVCADPTAPSLAGRLRPYLNKIFLITPNLNEAGALTGQTYTDRAPGMAMENALQSAQALLERGVRIAVVTLGVQGLVYASGTDRGQISAIRTDVQDETGAGDALTSGVIFGLLNEVPLDEALRLGVSAASLTLQSRETVVPNLSQELLYDQLTI